MFLTAAGRSGGCGFPHNILFGDFVLQSSVQFNENVNKNYSVLELNIR